MRTWVGILLLEFFFSGVNDSGKYKLLCTRTTLAAWIPLYYSCTLLCFLFKSNKTINKTIDKY